MISEKNVNKARENFELAAKEFGLIFHSPYMLTDTISAFGHIENYGSKNGSIIVLIAPPGFQANQGISEWCERNNFFCSFVNIQPLIGVYDASYFKEMLQDWGYFK